MVVEAAVDYARSSVGTCRKQLQSARLHSWYKVRKHESLRICLLPQVLVVP